MSGAPEGSPGAVDEGGDAIGDSARLMRDAFRRWGFTADVYALDLDPELVGDGHAFAGFEAGGPNDVVLLHYALPSPLTGALREHRGRRVLLHHSITPPEFFSGWDPELVRICREGRQALASLAGHVDLALGDSEWNRRELEDAGFERTGVLPIYLDFERYRQAPNPVLRRQLSDGRANLLFVGRVTPNKRHEDRDGLRLIRRLTSRPIGLNVLTERALARVYQKRMEA